MKLKRDKKWGFYICPRCNLPLKYDRKSDEFICKGYHGSIFFYGCDFKIKRDELDEV